MLNKKKKNLVIIGGGGAGLFTGATVKNMNKDFNVYLISNEDLFCRCSTPYVITKKANFKDTVLPDQMITNFGIELLKGDALEIDSNKKLVRYGNLDSSTIISYDVLVFATGARVFKPEIKGDNLRNVFTVRTSEDLKRINLQVNKVKSATIIGGGVIGIEMAAALKERGVKTNLMIIENKVFPRLADNEFRDLIEANLIKNNINIIKESAIKRIVGDKKVQEIIYEKEGLFHTLKTDILIFATGVRSNTKLAEEIGIKTNRFGIIVDDYMRTSKKDIYAVGDVAVTKNFITKEHLPSQLATNAVIQGKIAGKNISGFKTKYLGHTSAMLFQFLGDEFGSCGLTEDNCKRENIDYIIGISHSTDIYKDLKAAHNVLVKLIFNKKNRRVIGVQAYGRNTIWIVNLISFAIMQNSKIEDLMNFDYASHPSATPWPFMDPIVDACEHAMSVINNSKK